MDAKYDLTFFYRVKAKFSAEPGTIVLISAEGRALEELSPQIFTQGTYSTFHRLMYEHWDSQKAYFAVSRLEETEYNFTFVCKDFLRKETYVAGRILRYEVFPFKKNELNVDKLRTDFAELTNLLLGNSKAS